MDNVQTATATRLAWLNAFREAVLANGCMWATQPERLEIFMAQVSRGLVLKQTAWNKDTPANQAAWKSIGGKGKMTWKALFALPLE
jgi:hypothetical protein